MRYCPLFSKLEGDFAIRGGIDPMFTAMKKNVKVNAIMPLVFLN